MKLIWTEPAVLDLERIKDYISRDSEYYALALIEKIFESVEKLIRFPKIGREVPEYQDDTIREILCNNYRVIYKVDTNQIVILTVVQWSKRNK